VNQFESPQQVGGNPSGSDHSSLLHRYGDAGCVAGDVLWLLGGVHLNSSFELLVVNPLQKSWVGYTVKVGC